MKEKYPISPKAHAKLIKKLIKKENKYLKKHGMKRLGEKKEDL